MTFTEFLTARLNALIPRCALTWEPTDKGVRYLHPRKGWKHVSRQRLGVKFVVSAA